MKCPKKGRNATLSLVVKLPSPGYAFVRRRGKLGDKGTATHWTVLLVCYLHTPRFIASNTATTIVTLCAPVFVYSVEKFLVLSHARGVECSQYH